MAGDGSRDSRSARGGGPTSGHPIVYHSKADATYAELRHRILNSSLPPSVPINQEQLAADLGVSTTPLREALRRLESEGFVQMPAHRDVIIAPLDPVELIALYEVREQLDGFAARVAAKRHDEKDRAAIQKATARVQEVDKDDPLRRNREFHAAIYYASHNQVLIDLLDSLWDRSDRYRRAIRPIAHGPLVAQQHAELAAAVLARQGLRAERLMRAHVRQTRNLIDREILARQEDEADG
jgi:DNA-binding GntR family transcriptional regulator